MPSIGFLNIIIMMKQRHIFLTPILTIGLSLLLATASSFACDFDQDNIDDPLTYDESTLTWRANLSGSSSDLVVPAFGEPGGFLAPANYLGPNNPTMLGFISSNFFWNIRIPDGTIDRSLNFGRSDASYLSGHDFNGDGLADTVKIINRCSRIRKRCSRNDARFNILYNNVVGNDVFANLQPLVSGFFGKGLSPLFVIDANNDGRDDVCYARNLRRNKKQFRAFCRDVATQELTGRFRIGRVFNLPLAAKIDGQDQVILWKYRRRRADTRITVISVNGAKKSFFIPSGGTVVVGDWLGTGSDQIGVSTDGVLTIYNTLNGSISTMPVPAGQSLDCKNNISGIAAERFLTTRNSCNVLGCE